MFYVFIKWVLYFLNYLLTYSNLPLNACVLCCHKTQTWFYNYLTKVCKFEALVSIEFLFPTSDIKISIELSKNQCNECTIQIFVGRTWIGIVQTFKFKYKYIRTKCNFCRTFSTNSCQRNLNCVLFLYFCRISWI